MRKTQAVTLLLFVAFAGIAGAVDIDPAVALSAAKSHIAAKKYADALAVLEPAMSATDEIADPAQQSQARTALHFYSAVANSGLDREEAARGHLQEALRLAPNMRNLDTSKYDARFVKLFDQARTTAGGPKDDARDLGRFDELYPGFSASGQVPVPNLDPAIEILGTKAEKRAWRATVGSPEARERFMEEFWRARDSNPATPQNEFRETFARRVAFADRAFATPVDRGVLTDRGRVFVVLGVPAQVRRRHIDSSDRITTINRNAIGIEVGTIEYWFYNREQLPASGLTKPSVSYRFVTHQGIGDNVLQKDGIPMTVLAKVATASASE